MKLSLCQSTIPKHSSGHSGKHTKGKPGGSVSLGELFAQSCRTHPSKTFISPCGSCHLIPRPGSEWGSLRMPDVGNKGLKIIVTNNLPIYHCRRARALCGHASREPELTWTKEVQQQLLASGLGWFFFSLPLSLPRSCAGKSGSQQRSALSLPPSLYPSLSSRRL